MKQKQKPLSFSLHPDNHAYIEAVVLKQKETNHRYNRSMYMDDLITHLRTKSDVKPKPKAKVFDEMEYDNFPDDLHMYAWQEWIAFRKKAGFKKYKTDATMKKLAKMGSPEEQVLIVKQSIDNEYQGLFALKGNNNGHQVTGKKLSAHERVKQRNDIKYRNQSDECGLGMGENDGDLGRAVDAGTGRVTIEHVDTGTFVDYE